MNDTNPYTTSESEVIDLSADYATVKIFSATQRIGRVRYLAYGMVFSVVWYMIFFAILAALSLDFSNLSSTTTPTFSVASIIAMAILYLIAIAISVIIGVRRLHDLDKSGWWFLLFIVPLVNIGLAIYMLFFPGSPTENRFGKKPVPNSALTWIAGLAIPFVMVIGVLAAIALPAYQDYVNRAQSSEAIQLAEQIKPAIEQVYQEEGSFANASNGYQGIPQQLSGRYTAYIKVSDGIILAEMSQEAGPELAGEQFIIEPVISGDYIVWQCSFTGAVRLAPPNCR